MEEKDTDKELINTQKEDIAVKEDFDSKVSSLDMSSKEILTKMMNEQDLDKVKDLTNAFNVNQVKKNLVRTVRLNALLDKIDEQALERVTKRPDEITNKELFDFRQIVQSSIDKSQQSIETLSDKPLIQINNNKLNVSVNNTEISEDSKERILDAVQQLLQLYKHSDDSEIKTIDVSEEQTTDND